MDLILNSLNSHDKNCMVGSQNNYKFDLGVKGLIHGSFCNDDAQNNPLPVVRGQAFLSSFPELLARG